jgi:hypothetical protein
VGNLLRIHHLFRHLTPPGQFSLYCMGHVSVKVLAYLTLLILTRYDRALGSLTKCGHRSRG